MMRLPPGTLAPSLALLTSVVVTATNLSSTSTAMPRIVGDLGGLPLYSWTAAAYLLTATTAVPVYGKLADLYGRKPLFFVGTALFALGSLLCGLATTIEQLILFRALQGLGAAGTFPITLTIAGDLFSFEQRARFAGVQSSVWAIGAILGPVLASFIVTYASWRWVFWINLPIALLAALVLAVSFHERVRPRYHQIDYLGAALLTAGVGVLLWGLVEGGRSRFDAPAVLAALGAGSALLAALVAVERRAAEPVVPRVVVRDRLLALVSVGGFALGASIQSQATYLPLFIQGAQGRPPSDVAWVSGAATICWALGSLSGGRLVLWHGYRKAGLVGMAILSSGAALLTRLALDSPLPVVMATACVVSLGMGVCSTTFVVAVQTAARWEERGAVTGAHQFTRSMGGTVWVTVQGAALGAVTAGALSALEGLGRAETSSRFGRLSLLLEPSVRATLPAEQVASLATVLGTGLGVVFLLHVVIGLAGLVAVALLPGGPARNRPAATWEDTSRGPSADERQPAPRRGG